MKKVLYATLAWAPTLAFAATAINTGGIGDTLTAFLDLINTKVIPFLFAIAIVYFIWGLVKFVQNAGNEKEREAGKGMMIWGVVALAVMVSVYGLIGWVTGLANLTNTQPTLPTVK